MAEDDEERSSGANDEQLIRSGKRFDLDVKTGMLTPTRSSNFLSMFDLI